MTAGSYGVAHTAAIIAVKNKQPNSTTNVPATSVTGGFGGALIGEILK